ncbi:MAG: YciI family protein [Methylococcaceae bacterium]
MYYVIEGADVPNSLPLRMAARPAHLKRLEALHAEGRLLLAGPFPAIDSESPGEAGFAGSLIIARFDSLAEATDWAHADPYQLGGVYSQVSIKPFKQVFPHND